jgi:putative membrane protein
MLATLAAHPAAGFLAAHQWDGPHWWFIFFPLIPIFWITVLVVVLGLVRRRLWGGRGPWRGGPWGGPGGSGESVLGERYARGEIDEAEYRARLEVLRGLQR